MAQRDIVVKRKEGALTIPAPVLGTLSIPAFIGKGKGQKSDTNKTGNLGDALYVDFQVLGFGSGDYIEEIIRIEANGYIYKEGVHFRVYKAASSGGEPNEYLENSSLGISDAFDYYGIDFSQAPALLPPDFTLTALACSTNCLNGDYTVKVYSLDYDNKISETLKKMITLSGNILNIRWKKVDYVKGYIVEVYDGTNYYYQEFGNDVFEVNVDSSVLTGWNSGQASSAYSAGAKQTPGLGASVTIYYYTRTSFANQPKIYSSLSEVEKDHGYGSQLYNVAKYMFDLNVPFIYLVAVSEDSVAGYLSALDSLSAINNVHFIIPLTLNDTVVEAAHNQAISLSDPVNGQRERYAITALPYQWYDNRLKTFINGHAAYSDNGKRIFIGVFDGGEITLDYYIQEDGEIVYNTKVYDFEGNDITPIIGMAIAFGVYCSWNLTSLSLAEKNVPYVNFINPAWGDDVYIYLRNLGAFVVRNDSEVAIVDLDINPAFKTSVQDGQLPITRTEDWIKYDLRSKLKKYRGKTYPLQIRTDLVADYLETILKDYVGKGLIADYNAGSISISVTSDGKLHIYFRYTPVIIINQIEAEYEFDFIM